MTSEGGASDEGVGGGEGCVELGAWDDPKAACAAFRTAIALSMAAWPTWGVFD